MMNEIDLLRAEVARLTAQLASVPKTADGVPIYCGMQVFGDDWDGEGTIDTDSIDEIVKLRTMLDKLTKACYCRDYNSQQVICGEWSLEGKEVGS